MLWAANHETPHKFAKSTSRRQRGSAIPECSVIVGSDVSALGEVVACAQSESRCRRARVFSRLHPEHQGGGAGQPLKKQGRRSNQIRDIWSLPDDGVSRVFNARKQGSELAEKKQ